MLAVGVVVTRAAILRLTDPACRDRRRVLALACIWHVAVLLVFKYTGFFTGGALSMGWVPLGLSFFTFQQLWLLKEVYTGAYVPAQDERLFLFAFFFPTVTSGPILKPGDFFPQLTGEHFLHPEWEDVAAGLYAISCGTAKKVLLADPFGVVVNNGWAQLEDLSAPAAWLVILAYTFQLYLDFSGYCDIAAGAARLLLTGHAPETVALRTPKGIVVEVAPLFCRRTDTGAECAIEKDGGDDVDVTTGLPVIATVELLPGCTEIRIDGGRGVGRVTKPGLDQPVGAAAINHVPRQMIAEALRREAEAACYTGGFAVTISIQNGEEVARRTFNPHIGVEGGLSVLGTSGIVEPMSQQAILDTIQLEMNQAVLRAGTPKRLILAPGNYGLDYLHDTYPAFAAIPVVKTSNFIGDTLDMAASAGFEQVLLVGHVGKLVKVAGGIMNTHSHTCLCEYSVDDQR